MAYRRNPAFHRELAADPRNRAALARAAEKTRKFALQFSRQRGDPIMPRKGAPSSFVVDDSDEVRLTNSDHGGWIEEFGSVQSRPYGPLRRAVRAAGYRLTERK